jgi:hypothetical protein
MPRARDELLPVHRDHFVEDARPRREISARTVHHQHEPELGSRVSLAKLNRVAEPDQEVADGIETYDEHRMRIIRSRLLLNESVDWIENESPEPVLEAVVESENESLPVPAIR